MKEKPNLYLIYSKNSRNWENRLDYLEQAAQKLSINAIRVHADDFDYTFWQEIPARKTDMFYNVTPFSHEIENIFIHKGLTSFFIEPNKLNYLFSTHQFELSLINAGIPTPKTILKGTANRELLKKYVEYLGGFPLIVKVTGGTLGLGIVKCDSWSNLISTVDYLASSKVHFQLKEFIENEGTIRLLMVGDKEIGSIIRYNQKDDFRCSAPNVDSEKEKYIVDSELKALGAKICKSVNYDFVGIDIVYDNNKNPYVLEVNYPSDFSIPQQVTNEDVAFEAVKYLYEKSIR